MTEILTESFCERCGTRYTFESARPRTRLKGVKVLSRGLRNFVLSDGTSIDEAMAAARSETEREATVHQLDAFRKTFSFCMACRQYICPNCWNEAEVRCLSCAPLALPEAPAVVDDLGSFRAAGPVDGPTPGNGAADHEHEAWPVAKQAEELAAPKVEESVPAPATAHDATPVQASTGTGVVDPADKAASQTADLLQRFRPGQNLDAELDAYERERTGAEAAGTASVAANVEPAAADVEPAAAAADAADVVEQPTWRVVAPDSAGATGALPLGRPAEGDQTAQLRASASPTQAPAGEPQWPVRPAWPSSTSDPGLPFLGRSAAPQGGIEALWAASNQELAAAPPAPAPSRPAGSGIQPCVSCGLSLSANARFCRRCGTLQGR